MSSGTGSNSSLLRWNHGHEDGGDSCGDDLSEHQDGKLSLDRRGTNSPLPSLKGKGSVHSSKRSDTSTEDITDRAVSETGSIASRRSHTHRESISSDEGVQGVSVYSKRTNKSSKLRKPADEDAEKLNRKGNPNPGFPPTAHGYSADLSSLSGASTDLDHRSASHWTESDGAYSEFTSSSGTANHGAAQANRSPTGPNFPELDSEFSIRMEGIRGQRMRDRRPVNRSPAGTELPELDSEFSMRMEDQREQRMMRSQQARGGMRMSVRRNPETTPALAPNNRAVQSPHCCLHCRNDVCGAFLYLPQVVCCDNGTCRSCSHTCCYPSAAPGRHCHVDSGNLARRGGQLPNDRMETVTARDRNQPRKHSEWPAFGGASYILCYECDRLIQIPENFHFLGGGFNRMRCGGCSRVISYSLVDKTRIVRSSSTEFSGQLSGGCGTAARSIHGDSAASPPAAPQSEPSIYSEDCSSTENETDAGGSRNPTGRAKVVNKRRNKALGKLMGYFAATDRLN